MASQKKHRPGSQAHSLKSSDSEVDPKSPGPTPGAQPNPDPKTPNPALPHDHHTTGEDSSWTRPLRRPRVSKWKSPLRLVGFFIVGLACSLAHIIRYATRQGKVVGGSSDQERNIQLGTAMAFLSQITLSSSVSTAFTQWLWHTVQKVDVTVPGITALFSLDSSLTGFRNKEVWQKFPGVTLIALLKWSHVLAPFWTPGTLTVCPDHVEILSDEQVPIPAIANPDFGGAYSYSPSVKGDGFDTKNVTTRRFTGPRTMMALIGAHAASGQIWDMKPQYLNSQYSISFSGPTVKCEDADDVTSSLIEQKRQAKRRSQPVEGAIIVDDAYYAFVPHLDEQNNLKALDTPIYQEPSSRSRNELWMTFYRYYVDDEGFLRKRRYYQVCRLHNATYTIDLEWENGIQITRGDVEAHKPVEYPHDPRGTESNMAQHAYSAFFWALTDHLVGWLGYYQHPDCEVTIPEDLNCAKKFGVMATPIGRTALIGSDDLDVFFDFNEEKDEKGFLTREPSEQRKQDKMRANSTTLDVLIPRFAFNMTASILFNPLLTENVNAKVTRIESVNRYSYNRFGLYIPYALSNFFTLMAVISALISYKRTNVQPDMRFDNIVSAVEDPDVIHLVRNHDKQRGRSISTRTGETGQPTFGVSASNSSPLLGRGGLGKEARVASVDPT